MHAFRPRASLILWFCLRCIRRLKFNHIQCESAVCRFRRHHRRAIIAPRPEYAQWRTIHIGSAFPPRRLLQIQRRSQLAFSLIRHQTHSRPSHAIDLPQPIVWAMVGKRKPNVNPFCKIIFRYVDHLIFPRTTVYPRWIVVSSRDNPQVRNNSQLLPRKNCADPSFPASGAPHGFDSKFVDQNRRSPVAHSLPKSSCPYRFASLEWAQTVE